MYDQLQGFIDEYVGNLPEGSRRPAFGFQCYFAAGRVFGLYDGLALTLKFPTAKGTELLEMRMGKRFRHASSTFGREWIRINPARVDTDEVLETLIRESYDYVLGSV
jgi:hypothetical protein